MIESAYSLTSRLYRSLKNCFYEYTSTERSEENILIMFTAPRSGSTWLFDVLRCHPAISMHPRYFIYRQLGLRGRRYPRDLSNRPNGQLVIEVGPARWEKIPDPGADLSVEVNSNKRFNIEKIHPHFFDHDIDAFLDNVERLGEHRNLFFLYQVRRPKETLTSFLKYKERNPDWDHRALDEIPTHLRQVFESVANVADQVPGIVVDYEQLKRHFKSVVGEIYGELFERNCLSVDNLQAIRDATSRKKSKSSRTPFVGPKSSAEHVDDYESYFHQHDQEIERSYQAYEEILESC